MTPHFLSQELAGKHVVRSIQTTFLTLKLKSATPAFPDKYAGQRVFTVLIDKQTGQLLNVRSRFLRDARDMRPEPNATSAQAQLEATGERYLAFPTIDPKITFLDALDVVLSSGIGSPFHAKEIDGLYVMHSKGESDPRPAWVITLRGPPAHGSRRTRCAWNSGMAKEPYPRM